MRSNFYNEQMHPVASEWASGPTTAAASLLNSLPTCVLACATGDRLEIEAAYLLFRLRTLEPWRLCSSRPCRKTGCHLGSRCSPEWRSRFPHSPLRPTPLAYLPPAPGYHPSQCHWVRPCIKAAARLDVRIIRSQSLPTGAQLEALSRTCAQSGRGRLLDLLEDLFDELMSPMLLGRLLQVISLRRLLLDTSMMHM